jgi:hypothetical protein
MSNLTNSPNHFLASLPPHDADLLRPHLRRDELVLGTCLYETEQAIVRVSFPDSGIVSLVVAMSDRQRIEPGMFGRNGVIGGGAALDGRLAINAAIVQAAGSSLTIEAELLNRLTSESEPMRKS